MILPQSFAFAPLLAIGMVYTFSWRVAASIGYWPRLSLDDPTFAAPNDALADLLYLSVFPLLMWSVVALLIFPLLTFFLRRACPHQLEKWRRGNHHRRGSVCVRHRPRLLFPIPWKTAYCGPGFPGPGGLV